MGKTFELPKYLRRRTQVFASSFGDAILPLVGSLFVGIHFPLIDKVFLGMGKMERLKAPR
jgi:hypothetical protein